MSDELISRSPDLAALRSEGYEVAVHDGRILAVSHIPYVGEDRMIRYGTLIKPLALAGDVVTQPQDHVVFFSGEHPCDRQGRPLEALRHQAEPTTFAEGLVAQRSFSHKPSDGYASHQHLMSTYATILSAQAQSLDPTVTAKTFHIIETQPNDSVFRYADTASAQAHLVTATQRLAQANVAIVGLGGTGSYVLDLIAKTPIHSIHLFDGDVLLTHNAFRAPGAPSLQQLRSQLKKVDYFQAMYDPMRRNIVAHADYITTENVQHLAAMNFVFVCVDQGDARGVILPFLERAGISFVDVGMDLSLVDDQVLGQVRVTSSTPHKPLGFSVGHYVSLKSAEDGGIYDENIQVADLNALNAALAVMRWKKTIGFYQDFEHEHHTVYATNAHQLVGQGQP